MRLPMTSKGVPKVAITSHNRPKNLSLKQQPEESLEDFYKRQNCVYSSTRYKKVRKKRILQLSGGTQNAQEHYKPRTIQEEATREVRMNDKIENLIVKFVKQPLPEWLGIFRKMNITFIVSHQPQAIAKKSFKIYSN